MLRQTILLAAFALLPFIAACSNSSSKPHPGTIHSHKISFQTPTPGWSIAPVAAYEVANENWCIHQLNAPEGMVAQMISDVSGSISFEGELNANPVRHFVIGKTWAWNSNPEITFVESMDSLKEALADAKPLALISE